MPARARATTAAVPQPKNDAYVGLLIISLVAMLIGSALLFIDYSQYPSGKPTIPAVQTPPRPGAAQPGAAAPAGPGAAQPGVPPGGPPPGAPPAGNPQQPMP